MVIRTLIDSTGSIILQWHFRSALDSTQLNDKNAMLITNSDSKSRFSLVNEDSRSKASTYVTSTKTLAVSTSSECLVA